MKYLIINKFVTNYNKYYH